MVKKAKAKTKAKKTSNSLMMWVFVVLFLLIVISIAIILTLNSTNPNLNEGFFVSNDTKYVIDADLDGFGDDRIVSAHDVYYYDSNNVVTGHEAYYEFINEETVQAVLPVYQSTKDDEVEKVVANGRFIVMIANPTQYEGLNIETIKQWFENDEEQLDEQQLDENGETEENVDIEDDADYVGE